MGAGNANAAGTSGGGARTGFNTGMQGAPGMPRNVAAGGYPSKQGVGAMSGMLGAGPAMGAAGNALAGMQGMQGRQGMQGMRGMQDMLAGMRGMHGMQGRGRQGMQNPMAQYGRAMAQYGRAAQHTMPDGSVMPGATHGQQGMQGMQNAMQNQQAQMLNQQAIAANGEPAVTDFYNKLMASPGYQGGPAPMQGGKGSPR